MGHNIEIGDYVEIVRSDYEFNEGKTAKVVNIKGDSIRVFVQENGEEFWTDIDSISYGF